MKELENFINRVDIDKTIYNKIINNNDFNKLSQKIRSDDYREIIHGLNNELNGVTKESDPEEEALKIVEYIFDDYISIKYAKDNFTEKNKQDIEKLINSILTYYKKNIDSNTFLTRETKDKAINKLEKITIRIGYPEDYEIYSNNYNINANDNLFNNLIRINNYTYSRSIKMLNTNEESKNWGFSLTDINAFYNPQDNSINFPAALYKVIDDNPSDYELLGSVGFIVAHEVTHAFDNNGSLFDEKGEFNNWWTKKDIKAFDERKQKVIDYYNEYTVLGMNVDGEKTLGENIADLGAVKCITSIAEEKDAKEEDYKTMYKAFANFFMSKYTDSYTKLVAAFDVHSPNDVRINATLSSTDKFYDVYKINDYDKMYKDSNNRVSVW